MAFSCQRGFVGAGKMKVERGGNALTQAVCSVIGRISQEADRVLQRFWAEKVAASTKRSRSFEPIDTLTGGF